MEIDASLDTNNSYVTFKHSGQPFSADNIRFLIEQISTKDRKKDESGKQKTTGKFGTGFLATHLLSEKVYVRGVAKEPDLDYRKFTLVLDRSGYDIETITEGVRTAKKSVENLDDSPPYCEYVEGALNTEFSYCLTDELSRKIARNGLSDLDRCIPYTLVFVKELETVTAGARACAAQFDRATDIPSEEVSIVCVSVEALMEATPPSIHMLAVLRKNFSTIAVPVRVSNGITEVVPIAELTPRLFCEFPLIGTEHFPFPVVVNNPNFNPTDPRDGIFLNHTERPNPGIEENKLIIQEAVALYLKLLKYAVESGWRNLHLLADMRSGADAFEWLDSKWCKNYILTPIRNALLRSKIVRTADKDTLASIASEDEAKYVWFPQGSTRQIREKLWLCCNSWFPHQLPKRSDVELWNALLWDECGKLTVSQLAKFVENMKTVDALAEALKGKAPHEWLADFYGLLTLEVSEVDLVLNKYRIFPNQNGVFCKKSELYKDVGDIPDDFKDILKLLGRNLRDTLLPVDLGGHFEFAETRDQAYAIKEITSEVQEKANDRGGAVRFRPAFKKLLLWFRENPDRARSLFPTLYRQKHVLYDDDEVLENIEKAEQLAAIFTDFKLSSVTELRQVLAKQTTGSLLPITQEILVNMGISSVAEWSEAIKDANLADLFSHESTPTTDMFVYAQSLITKAKGRIIEHLRTQPSYDLAQLDETAPTVLAGILKEGQEVTIVVRPAYNREVIIYYGSERDVLDYEHSELWVDDGVEPRRITLGHILKTAGIRKFPI